MKIFLLHVAVIARTKASYDEDVIFRCHGDYELTENIVGRNESITTIIYVPAGNEIDNSSFNVTCLLVNTKGESGFLLFSLLFLFFL